MQKIIVEQGGSTKELNVENNYSTNGWTSIFANVADGTRVVQKIIDLVGGTGTKPSGIINKYMGTFLGEGRETLHTIGNIATKTAMALDHLRHGRISNAFRAIGGGNTVARRNIRTNPSLIYKRGVSAEDLFIPGDLWLEFTYGISPMLNDAKSSAEALNQILNNRLPRTRYKSVSEVGNFGPTYPMKTEGFRKDKVVHVAHYSGEKLTPNTFLNLNNPLAVAWEVVPLSFVVDWFIPIGDYLHANGDAHNIKFEKVIRSHLSSWESWFTGFGTHTIPATEGFPDGRKAHEKGFEFRREIIGGSSVPSHLLRTPPKMKKLFEIDSWKHAVSGIALATQMFK